MFFNIINYTLLLAAPYMVSAVLSVTSHTKYAKNPSPAYQIRYGVCHDVPGTFGGYNTDAASNKVGLGIKFLIVDYSCDGLETAPGAVTALNALTPQIDGLMGRPVSECYIDCVPTPDLWGCQ
ncbi:hypothetical protein TWF730_000435 [Orbilia blumenaviensis]|uniref:Uncharacterized protein n=1 Tax=Orbilia blumenaviensis TaxID=1796055 RepID=A0AAV9VML8_9PEZI